MARRRPAAGAPLPAAEIPRTGRLLAIDVGAKRIGIAISDPSQTIAQPLATLTRRPGRRFPLRQLAPHLERQQPVAVVVGLPLAADGTETAPAEQARATGRLIAEKTALPVTFWDERFSTARALETVRALEGSTRGRRGDVDRLAAAVLLQAFLDRRRAE